MLSSDEQINSLLILFPPELKAVPTMPFMLNGGISLCRYFGVSLYLRSLSYENNCQKVKSRYAAPDMWYCMCFVVKPQLQGQGVGSRLIRPALGIFERNHIPLYLETHKKTNVEIYKHYGFEVVDCNPIPKTEIMQYSMVRSRKINGSYIDTSRGLCSRCGSENFHHRRPSHCLRGICQCDLCLIYWITTLFAYYSFCWNRPCRLQYQYRMPCPRSCKRVSAAPSG